MGKNLFWGNNNLKTIINKKIKIKKDITKFFRQNENKTFENLWNRLSPKQVAGNKNESVSH